MDSIIENYKQELQKTQSIAQALAQLKLFKAVTVQFLMGKYNFSERGLAQRIGVSNQQINKWLKGIKNA